MWGFYGGSVESVWRLALWEAAGAFFQVNRGFRVCGRYVGMPPKPIAASRARQQLHGLRVPCSRCRRLRSGA
ncbi:hypothetical protein C4K24_5688 [Pseudomonas chlororaphis subsp. aurantiaca]|nr:hypothetical protein C4K24_5688 [Pseudomonas chlororaphis subsp. aurantiaca]